MAVAEALRDMQGLLSRMGGWVGADEGRWGIQAAWVGGQGAMPGSNGSTALPCLGWRPAAPAPTPGRALPLAPMPAPYGRPCARHSAGHPCLGCGRCCAHGPQARSATRTCTTTGCGSRCRAGAATPPCPTACCTRASATRRCRCAAGGQMGWCRRRVPMWHPPRENLVAVHQGRRAADGMVPPCSRVASPAGGIAAAHTSRTGMGQQACRFARQRDAQRPPVRALPCPACAPCTMRSRRRGFAAVRVCSCAARPAPISQTRSGQASPAPRLACYPYLALTLPALPCLCPHHWTGPAGQLYGETGAQSSIVHAFDAALGVRHDSVWLKVGGGGSGGPEGGAGGEMGGPGRRQLGAERVDRA